MPSLHSLWSRSLVVLMLGIGLVVTGLGFARSAEALDPVGGHLVVTVTDERSGEALEGARVALQPADWDGVSAPLLTTTSDADGAADLDASLLDPTASYKVLVEADGHDARWAAAPAPVATADLATAYAVDPVAGTAVSVALPQLRASVTGVVQDAGSQTPLSGALVCLDDAPTEAVDAQVCRLSRADGAFTLPAWSGSYLLRVGAPERAPYVGTEPVALAAGSVVALAPVSLEPLPQLVPLTPATVSTSAPVVGTAVAVTTPTFAEADVRTDVAWFVGNRPKPVAVGDSFIPLKQYAGKQLSVAVVSTVAGYRPAVAELAVGVVTAPAAKPVHQPVVVTPPVTVPVTVVRGPSKARPAKVGKVAAVTAPVVADGAQVSYQWLANGKAIKGATKRTYRVTRAKRGKTIAVRVTASVPGRAPYVRVIRLGVAR